MSGSGDISSAMRLQAYALLLNQVQEPIRRKLLGQIVKELNLPITVDELKASDTPLPVAVGPVLVLCPFCHDTIKIDKPLQSQEEFMAKVREHLPSCAIVEAIAAQVASKISR